MFRSSICLQRYRGTAGECVLAHAHAAAALISGADAGTNSGSIGGGVAGIYIGGSATATVTNFGTISGRVFGIDVNTTEGVTVINHGTIKPSSI
jgi:hypothetical protein